ncbi:hypothetical protein ACOJVU_01235 [Mycobacterium sp. THU-M104]|uniref:hypothetical protein n=1 Tax=Mycobacterium sp. THU-M104 TaxID=3410515 RepID=UPI003B9BF424
MKLARPDLFHPRIVLAGCPRHVTGDGDDAGLVAALRHRGLHARWLSWDDPETNQADLVILRATSDYAERLDAFLDWMGGLANVLNPLAVVAWNADRHYLADLAQAGVPTVPGEFFAPGERIRLPRSGHVFVGPAVGTGSRRRADRVSALADAGELHRAGRSVLLQACDASPESVLVFLGGELSHAFTLRGRALVGAEPDPEVWAVGAAALAAAAARTGHAQRELLYARAHIVGDHRDPCLLELQLVEPSLGWRRLEPGARDLAERGFALAVESACDRLGLGPSKHPFPQ